MNKKSQRSLFSHFQSGGYVKGASNSLIKWYEINKRDLPWRHVKDPYKIWVSEVILQQTRVVQGLPFYYRFLEAFPNVFELARADENTLLRIWQGLGYYSRARNMHSTAKEVVSAHKGHFPQTKNALMKLKGIGPYTASAIASFAFNEPTATVDGNVSRAISRLFAIEAPIDKPATATEIKLHAETILDRSRPGLHNQAMMELGAMVCTPALPKCDICPVNSFCRGREKGIQASIPVKQGKVKRRARTFHYIVVSDLQGKTIIRKRDAADIWQGLFEFPMVESGKDVPVFPAEAEAWEYKGKQTGLKHVLSHQDIYPVYHLFQTHDISRTLLGEVIEAVDIGNYPFPRMIVRFLEKWLK